MGELLPLLLQFGLGAGDTLAQLGANFMNLGDRQTALGSHENLGRYGHDRLGDLGSTMNNAYGQNAQTTHRMLFGEPAMTDQRRQELMAQGIDPAKYEAENPVGSGGLIPQAQQGYRDLHQRNMGRVEQIGAQEKKDINRAFDSSLNNSLASAQQRGLGSSTVMGSMRRGNARERSDALARSYERDLNRQVGVDSSLGGQAIGQNVNLGMLGHNTYQNAFNQQMGQYENSVLRPLNFEGQQTGNLINLLGGFQNQYMPTSPNIYSQLGAGTASTPDYSQNSAAPWIGAATAPVSAFTFGLGSSL